MNLKDAIKQAGSGARGAKFSKIGQIIGGVVESAEIFQSRDEDGDLETWDDGQPKNKLRIIVQTELDEGVDDDGREDDGRRAIYIKWWGEQRKEFLSAMEKAGLDDLVAGSKAFAKYVSDGEKVKKSWSAPKNMKYKFIAPPSVPMDDFDEDDGDEVDEPPARPAKRPAAKAPVAKAPAAKAAAPRRLAPEPKDDEDKADKPPARTAAKAPAAKAPTRRRPAPEPEDVEDDDLDGVGDPVDDTADALSEAGLGDDDF